MKMLHYATSEEHADGIDQREDTRYEAVVGVCPVELGANEVLPREREHLPIEVVNRRCEEEQRADDPAIGCRAILFFVHNIMLFSLSYLGYDCERLAALLGYLVPLLGLYHLFGEEF